MKKNNIFGYRSVIAFVFLAVFSVVFLAPSMAQGDASPKSTEELVVAAWAASTKGDYAELDRIFNEGLKIYEVQALTLGSALTTFPSRDKIQEYKVMNDIATLHFVRAEALMNQGKNDEAIALFQELIKEYPYAQSWDPSRGSYWSIAEKSQASIDVMSGVAEEREEAKRNAPLRLPVLANPGKDAVIDYTKYGTFSGIGTSDYKFQMGSPSHLSDAAGEGVFPNTSDVLKDPRYREVYQENRLNGSHWDFVNTRDLEAAFFKWATASEHPGLKLFYTGLIFEKAGMYLEAIKAYHALIVHFPKSFGMTYWQTPWYPAQAAVAKIQNILRFHPELNLRYTGGKVRVINGADNNPGNDVFIVSPGTIVAVAPGKGLAVKKQPLGGVKRRIGGKKIYFNQYKNGHWQMMVNGKPYIIKGITYAPTKVGQSPDKGTVENWMYQDGNGNGKADSPYDSWVDKNRNNEQDADESVVGDFQLMKEMGVNTIRLYHNNFKINKEILRDLYQSYGIRVIMGDFLGKYTLGSGAEWSVGTDYENPVHRANMMKSVEDMVMEFKDEPFVLMWLLGNENNYGVASNADKKPDAYFQFVNEVAARIKELDPNHPVAACNGDVLFLEKFAKLAQNVDALGANIYRGDYGFGSFWDEVRETADKPAFITEYGAPAYSQFANMEEAEGEQAAYHKGNWLDIQANTAGEPDGEGNAVGGVAFEWMDEWWKNYEPAKHDTKADVIGPFAGGYYFEEWFGLVGQGNGKHSPFMRQPRKAYDTYKEMWNK